MGASASVWNSRLIDKLVAMGQSAGCYKIILDCARSNVGFYQGCQFEEKGVEMVSVFSSPHRRLLADLAQAF